jgi:hypothetical protein
MPQARYLMTILATSCAATFEVSLFTMTPQGGDALAIGVTLGFGAILGFLIGLALERQPVPPPPAVTPVVEPRFPPLPPLEFYTRPASRSTSQWQGW